MQFASRSIALLEALGKCISCDAFLALVFDADLAGRVLPFDSAAAREFDALAASRRRASHAMSQADAQIAAIVQSRGAALATRNVADFAGCPFEVIDPWQ